MKLPQIGKKFQWNYVGLAFALPTVLMLLVLLLCSYEPFGQYSLLYSDMYHQYYPFFFAFRKALLSGESLLWNWSAGMGMDYLGLISYYLASPLNLLSVLVPEGWVLEYFALLMPIKLGLAGGFFAIMLKKLFEVDDLSLTLFGSMYALCAWALGYQWNIMWLDTFALLPLVMLGAVRLLRDKKFVLYTVTLFLSIFANYYVGFFICIFILLFFFCYEICRFRSVGRFLADLGRIALFSLLAIGMTAVLELPALQALQNTYSGGDNLPYFGISTTIAQQAWDAYEAAKEAGGEDTLQLFFKALAATFDGFDFNFTDLEQEALAREAWTAFREAKAAQEESFDLWWAAIKASFEPLTIAMKQVAGHVGGGSSPTFMDGPPNLYCGVFAIPLGFLFLLAREVKLRDKICAVALLLFLLLSCIIRQLDFIWHGFHFTNQIPYRFSFLFSFVLLYMAYRAWLLRNSFKIWQLLLSAVLSVMLFVWPDTQEEPTYLIFNLAFTGLYFVCMLYAVLDIPQPPALEEQPQEEWISAQQLLEELGQLEDEPVLPAEEPIVEEPTAEGLQELPAAAQEAAQEPQLETQTTEEQPQKPAQSGMDRFFSSESRRQLAAMAIACVMLLELALNVGLFAARFPATYAANYPSGTEDAASMIRVMEELEKNNPFYRAEVTHSQTLNDGALNSYNGITTFTSSANVRVTEYLQTMGFAAKNTYNRYLYEATSPVANLFLGLKYMLERNGFASENAYFDAIHTYGKVTLLENNAYLPLGFLAGPALKDLKFSVNANSIAFQNELFSAATGLEENVWQWVPAKDLTVTTENATLSVNNASGYCSYKTEEKSGRLIYTYTVTQAGLLCVDANFPQRNNFSAYKNGELLFTESVSLPQMFAVCDVQPGDVVKVTISCDANQSSSVTLRAATVKEELFRQGYDILNASTLQLSECTTDYVAGTIRCNRDGLLYTSIPQDGNWKAYVDGRPVEPVLVGEVMLSLELTEGLHEVEFRYENQSFVTGAWISFGCAAVLAALAGVQYWFNKRKNAQA